MKKWGMAIDLKKCVGCQTCTLSCKVVNSLGPNVVRCKVVEFESGIYPDVERTYVSLRCMHCAEPECLKACPTGATQKRDDGIVTVDQGKCMGCRYCSLVCPYQARTFLTAEDKYFNHGSEESAWETARSKEHTVGTMEKCDFCYNRIDEGMANGLRPGIDHDATPLCVISCIGKALKFGDLNDPDSEVSALIRELKGYTLKPELGTEPSIYYLPKR